MVLDRTGVEIESYHAGSGGRRHAAVLAGVRPQIPHGRRLYPLQHFCNDASLVCLTCGRIPVGAFRSRPRPFLAAPEPAMESVGGDDGGVASRRPSASRRPDEQRQQHDHARYDLAIQQPELNLCHPREARVPFPGRL